MIEVFTYIVDLPHGVHEMVAPCADGYTVYLSSRDERHSRFKHYLHAVRHIVNGDFEKEDVQEIEAEAHT